MRTLYQAGKLAQASRILKQYNLALIGMSEVRWNQSGQLSTSKGHLMLWSGMPNENDPHQRGVGFLVHRNVRNSVMSYKFVSERIIVLRLRGQPKQYNALDKRVRRATGEDNKDYIHSLASTAEEAAAVYNMKDLFEITRKIAGKTSRSSLPVKIKYGRLLTNIEEQLSRWREHFNEVLNLQRDGIVVTHVPDVAPRYICTVTNQSNRWHQSNEKWEGSRDKQYPGGSTESGTQVNR